MQTDREHRGSTWALSSYPALEICHLFGGEKNKTNHIQKNPKHTKTNKPKTIAQIPHSKTLLLSLEGEKDEEGGDSQD